MSHTCKRLTLSWVLGSARDTMSRRAYRTTECLSIREMSSNRYMLSKAFKKFNGDSLDMIIWLLHMKRCIIYNWCFMVFDHLRVGYRAGTGHSLPRRARGRQPSVPSPLPFHLSSECLWSWQSCGKYQNMQKWTKHTCTGNCTCTYVQKDLYDSLLFALSLENEQHTESHLISMILVFNHWIYTEICKDVRMFTTWSVWWYGRELCTRFHQLKVLLRRPPTCPVSVFPVFSESRTGSAFLLDTCTASHLPPLILHVIQQGYYYTNDSVDKREGKFYKIKFL